MHLIVKHHQNPDYCKFKLSQDPLHQSTQYSSKGLTQPYPFLFQTQLLFFEPWLSFFKLDQCFSNLSQCSQTSSRFSKLDWYFSKSTKPFATESSFSQIHRASQNLVELFKPNQAFSSFFKPDQCSSSLIDPFKTQSMLIHSDWSKHHVTSNVTIVWLWGITSSLM